MTKFFCKKMHFFSKKVLFGAKNGGMAAICDRNFGEIAKKQSLFSKCLQSARAKPAFDQIF